MTRIVSIRDWRRKARRRLPRFVFDYLDGGADDERGLCRNIVALRRATLQPERLANVATVSLKTSILGFPSQAPLIVAPTGLNGLFWRKGDISLARAASRAGIPFVLSTASTATIEEVATAATGEKWFQLYVFGERRISEGLMSRAWKAGYSTLVLTVDVAVNGNRERDIRNGFTLPFKPRARLLLDALSHPQWLVQLIGSGTPQLANFLGADDDQELRAALLSRTLDRSLTWQSIDWIRDNWPGPIVLKGVLTRRDAIRARDCGVSGIVVSNHGGRQLDAFPAAVDVISSIVSALGPNFPVMIDSGFRRGADIIKGVALGAHAVLVGRPVLYGLAAAGEAGAGAVLDTLMTEAARTLTLIGLSDIRQLARKHVRLRK